MFGLETIYYQLILLGVFVAATFIGYILINKVPPLLHTPLMSGMNALSGVTVLGALIACALLFREHVILSATLGAVAIALAMVNVVGGFVVTDKMLGMIAKKRAPKQALLYVITAVVAAAVVALMVMMTKSENGQWFYLGLSVLLTRGVLIGIAMMSKVTISKIGNRISAVCMLLAIALTVINNSIAASWTIYIGLALGIVVGLFLALKVKMIQMPQMVALLNGLGGAASALVGGFAMAGVGSGFDVFSTITASVALAVGMLTLLGSLVAAGKLRQVWPPTSVVYRGHQFLTMFCLAMTLLGIVGYCVTVAM